MAEPVFLPKVGMTMEEGTVARWLVEDEAEVHPGEPIFELETEKVNIEIEAEASGILKQLVPEDTKLKPGDVVGCILANGESVPSDLVERVRAQLAGSPPMEAQVESVAAGASAGARTVQASEVGDESEPDGRIRVTPVARRVAAASGVSLAALVGTGPGGRITEFDVRRAISAETALPAGAPAAPVSTFASPIARRIASENGIELATVTGTGPNGRVTERDVLAYIDERARPKDARSGPLPPPVDLPKPPADVLPYRGRRGR